MGPRPCPNCGEYLEFAGEAIDDTGTLYDLFVCIECSHEEAIPQDDEQPLPASREWDPPDGAPQRGI